MFEKAFDRFGKPYLKYVDRRRYPGERGLWVDIGHQKDKEIQYYIRINELNGYEVLMDENGTYRVEVLKD